MPAGPLQAARLTFVVLAAVALLASCGGGGSADGTAAGLGGSAGAGGVPSVPGAAINQAPLITSAPVTSGVAGTAYRYDVNASDPDGDTLTYSLLQAPGGMTFDVASGRLAWTPSSAQIGTHAVSLRAADSAGLSVTQVFSVSVVAADAAPQITSAPLTTAAVGAVYAYPVNASDANGHTLTYSLAAAPSGMAIDSSSGLITWTPLSNQAGSQAVAVRVADPGGLAVTQAFSIMVAVGNAAPQITTTPVTTATVGVAFSYGVRATDPNGDTLTYSLTQAPSGMAIAASSGLITWIPLSHQAGSQVVAVRVTDPGSLASTQVFSISVALANAAPQITSTPITTGWVGVAYGYGASATDPNGDALTYSLLQAPSGMTISASSGLIAWTPAPGQVGTQAVTLRAADPGGLAVMQAFAISVLVPNAAPRITTTPVTTGLVGGAYSYDVDATDPNGDTLTFSLTQAPTGMTINASNGLISWMPSSTQTGSQAVAVRVVDPGGLSATQAFTVFVPIPNAAPQITGTAVVTAAVGVTYGYGVRATDPNGDPLSYALTQAPSGMTINAANGLISWVPSSTQTGSQAVAVRVIDPGGLAATQSFTISVGGGTRADMATPASYSSVPGSMIAITLNWGRVPMAANYLQFMHLVNTAGQTWSVDDQWTTSATWTTGAFTETRTITVPAGMPSGTYDVRVGLAGGNPWLNLFLAMGSGVTDPGGDRRYRVASLTVIGNRAPSITTAPVTTATAGVAYSYDVNATDPDGDTLTYSLTQAPGGMVINPSNGLIAWTPSSGQTGSQAVAVRVADPGGLAATQSFSIAVAAPANAAPLITSTAVTTATAGAAYSYGVNATDPNGDTLTYSLTQAPSGMTINGSNGLISWTPASSQTGGHGVTVRTADPGGLAATQVFSIIVSPVSTPGPMTMSCPDGAGRHCSGETVLRTDNGIALTRSGVQAYGRSTSDMGATNPNLSTAYGLALAIGGVAELRIRKDANAAPTGVAVLLSNMGILWNGQSNRPQIIETFTPTAGSVQLAAGGALLFGALPPSSDLSYYDYAYLGTGANKLNYANNRYFPRANPPRCEPGGYCATLETVGPQFGGGSWRWGGSEPDWLSANRNHEDGDVHAGNGLPDANGNPTWLAGGSGFGVPVPGSKGYRSIEHWNYQYGNLASWFTQDTVNIVEWGGVNEHNKIRRGFVAFGDTTDPALVPTSASATYSGVVRGRYSASGSDDPVPFVGTVTVTVNFASRSVSISIQNTVRTDGLASVPVTFVATTVLGTGGNANHLTGAAANATLSGGVGGRLFGPVVAGGSGTGPSEVGGAFSLSNSSTGAAVVAGFIARKQ